MWHLCTSACCWQSVQILNAALPAGQGRGRIRPPADRGWLTAGRPRASTAKRALSRLPRSRVTTTTTATSSGASLRGRGQPLRHQPTNPRSISRAPSTSTCQPSQQQAYSQLYSQHQYRFIAGRQSRSESYYATLQLRSLDALGVLRPCPVVAALVRTDAGSPVAKCTICRLQYRKKNEW